MQNYEDLLKEFNLTKLQLEKISLLYSELFSYNKKVNLTGLIEPQDFYLKNVKDSLGILNFFNLNNNKNILDVGSGGGFPGLVLAIACPNSRFYLNDSITKKTKWLTYISEKLKLNNIVVLSGRIENLEEKNFDLIVSRAVEKTAVFLELTANKLKLNGNIVLYKGKNYDQEIKFMDSKKLKNLNLKFLFVKEWKLDLDIHRYFLVFKKNKNNNDFRLRKYSDIKQKPLF